MDSVRDEVVKLACDLIGFESSNEQSEHIAAAMDYVAHYLYGIPGVRVTRSVANNKPALVATLYDTRTPALMLNGHIDVIPAHPDQFTAQVRHERIYGRGSQDMKGSVAVLLRLFKELAACDPRPDVGLQIVSDEEIGGEQGTGRLLEEGWRCGLFLAAEPTNLRICYEQKGIMWVRLKLHGCSAHGSHPWEGHNPLVTLGEGLVALANRFPPLTEEAWCTTITPTRVRSSEQSVNQVPRNVLLSFDIRYVADDSPERLLAAVQDCFPGAEMVQQRHAVPLITDPQTPAVQRLSQAVQQVRGAATLYREHYGSDARFYSHQGIPALCFGPIGAGMHADEEWVDIESLLQLYHALLIYGQTFGA